MKKIVLISRILIVIALSAMVLSPVVVSASAKEAVCSGAGLVGGATGCTPSPDSPTVDSLIGRGLNLFSAIIGIIAVVMIMLGGVKYITSQGDAAQAASAKNTILYAAIGLVVAAMAQIIVRFVLNRFITP